MRAWILYSALRVGMFAVLFLLLWALTASVWPSTAIIIAAIGAAVLSLCLSYIFLKPLRDRVALQVVEARSGTPKPSKTKAGSDEDVEDTIRGE